MPVSPDVMEIVRLLDEEGFGLLASELMGEVALGAELGTDAGDSEVKAEDVAKFADRFVLLDNDAKPLQRYFDVDGGQGEPPPRYESIPEPEQLAFAMEFLRLRLVEPMRHLAEAERLAGELVSTSDGAPAKPIPDQIPDEAPWAKRAVRIAFAPEPTRKPFPADDRDAGSSTEADDLAEILQRISKVDS